MILIAYIFVPVCALVAAGSLAIARYGSMPGRLPRPMDRGSTDNLDVALRQLFASHNGRAEAMTDLVARDLPDDEWLAAIKAEANFRRHKPAQRSVSDGVDVRYRPVLLDVVLPSSA
jgi:hypothetical protein